MPRSFPFLSFAWLILGSAAFAQLPPVDPPRAWKTTEGTPFQATLLDFDGTNATFKMAGGAKVQVPVAKLGADDQQYLAAWLKKRPIVFTMPEVVEADAAAFKTEVVTEDAAAGKFVYRTRHFEYESPAKLSTSLQREIARDFEATFELLKVLPWNVEPKPPSGTHFKARLLKDRQAYAAAGGPESSGAVYLPNQEIFLVPFESIGLKPVGKSFTKGDDFDSSSMVHELTHQMMHSWLILLPAWIVEGTAEYTSNLPLHAGRFRVGASKTGLRDYLDLKKRTVGGVPVPFSLEKLFDVTGKQWIEYAEEDPLAIRRMYYTSYLLVYYFMHLDGNKDGQRFIRYFREVGAARQAMEDYEAALAKFQNDPRVVKLPSGLLSFPKGLPAPEAPAFMASQETIEAFKKKTLEILLDGRTHEELMKQIRAAYLSLGIKL